MIAWVREGADRPMGLDSRSRAVAAELGVGTGLSSTRHAVAFAKTAEAAGFDRMGLTDTSPEHYQGVYPAVTACLLQTAAISVGTYVTNPVTRHWSVHSMSARGLEELAPGRFFLGMGTGDGSVYGVGLKPATLSALEVYMESLRRFTPSLNVHMVFSGPKGMEVAGRLADEVTIGTGLDVGALRALAARARAARLAAGVSDPLRVWATCCVYFAEAESAIPQLRDRVRSEANAIARLAFDQTFEGKNVPDDYLQILRNALSRYDHAYHGLGGDNPNSHLFDDHPEVQDYVIDRMMLIGTRGQCAERLENIIRDAQLDGIWLVQPAIDFGTQLTGLRIMAETFTHLNSHGGER
jgi:alkanesulfonate monooxygenase SsuD/methylene tetrahydromethanopterin reductase-like flavin-dependent oxidoreductase (luciferase family)